MEIPATALQHEPGFIVLLLTLLNEVKTEKPQEIEQEFFFRFGHIVPPKFMAKNNRGKAKWAYKLQWARYDLVLFGFMREDEYGVWKISEKGRSWLTEHSDFNDAAKAMMSLVGEKNLALRGKQVTEDRLTFRWRGQKFHVDAKELESRALEELRLHNPPEAFRFQDWFVQIEDKRVSVKWLFHLLTGAGFDEFVTYQAVTILQKMGFDIQKIGGKVQSQHESDHDENKQESNNSYDLHGDEFEQFISEITKVLPHCLPAIANHAKINAYPDSKLIKVNFSEIHYAHYEMSFRQEDEIAFHFECQLASLNLERLEQVKPLVESWSNSLGTPIQAEKWGGKRARISIRLSKGTKSIYGLIHFLDTNSTNDYSQKGGNFFFSYLKAFARQNPDLPFWQQKAIAYAGMMAKFIEVTFPDLQRLLGGNKHREGSTISISEYGQDSRSHRMLDQKISEIRNFIAGRAIRIPKDDELCDWIQLCYFFELPREGQELFRFVQPQVLNNEWLYRRAKKYSDLCRIKAPLIG